MLYAEIQNPQITARQAAEQWAETAFGQPRKVRGIEVLPGDDPTLSRGCSFNLVDGVKEYQVRPLPNYAGWAVGDLEGLDAWGK